MFYFQSADRRREEVFRARFQKEFPDLAFVTSRDAFDPDEVRYLFSWMPPDLSEFGRLEIVFSVSAGVEQFAALPEGLPLVRMVDPTNTRKVSEYVLMACLALVRDIPFYVSAQAERRWSPHVAPLLAENTIGILGLGEIGTAAGRMLHGLGADVIGWSRAPKTIEGIRCVSGEAGLDTLLREAAIVVCLLPLTPQTSGILNHGLFDRMRAGAGLVHVGRGAHCVIEDLHAALEQGKLGGAFIDVFPEEPLPAGDPGWQLPRAIITPHVAGRIDDERAAENVICNIRRHRNGEPLLWLVDREAGY